MGAGSISLGLPWAVHISDGVLRDQWWAGGFVVSGLLSLLAAYRVRDEEIPRIAVLSAAFFVASLMHLRLGPTSVHLLLNGLVGVVLGRRAPLAILIGLGLQAALLGHGGFTTIGINACILTFPALLAGWMFAGLHRLPWVRRKQTSLLWISGCIIGMTSVLATLILNAVVLLWGGAEDWHQIVWLVFYAHLPIVALEGVVLGFTVNFLARVKPEMLGVIEDKEMGGLSADGLHKWRRPASTSAKSSIMRPPPDMTSSVSAEAETIQPPLSSHPPALLLVALTMLFAAGSAHAHRLDAGCSVLANHQVRIESWFNPGGPARGLHVQVFRPGQMLLAEGQLDEEGHFVFHFAEAEPLEVVVSAAGHRKSFVSPREQLERTCNPASTSDPSPESVAGSFQPMDPDAAWREHFKDALIGIGFLLSLGAFLLSWRNGQKLKALQQRDGNRLIG